MTGVQPAPWTLDMTSVIFEFDLTSGAGDEGRLWWRHNLLALWTLWSSPPSPSPLSSVLCLFQGVNLAAVRRMYLALVLFSLLKETDVWSVSERFQLSRGFVQTLLGSASAFCSCVLHFAEVPLEFTQRSYQNGQAEGEPAGVSQVRWWCSDVSVSQELEEFWPFRALLAELTRRLSYCVKAELIPLMEVAGVLEVRHLLHLLSSSSFSFSPPASFSYCVLVWHHWNTLRVMSFRTVTVRGDDIISLLSAWRVYKKNMFCYFVNASALASSAVTRFYFLPKCTLELQYTPISM